MTSWELSLFVFYALPILLVVWKLGRPAGFVFVLVSTFVWWGANQAENPYQTRLGFAVAAISRGVYFLITAIAGAAVKAKGESDRLRIETLERSRELEREILHTSEREQQRIGRDLHDGLGPHLAAIGYAAAMLMDELRKRGEPEAARAEQIRQMAVDAVSLTRDLARGVFPVQMDGSGLAMALEEFARTTSRLTGVSVVFCENGESVTVGPEVGMHLYRIVQEAVNNATKHGGAKNITVVLARREQTLTVVVADDGRGMAADSAQTRGMGLHSMRFRAHALGGEIEIKSNPDDGTIVSCEIPHRGSASTTPSIS